MSRVCWVIISDWLLHCFVLSYSLCPRASIHTQGKAVQKRKALPHRRTQMFLAKEICSVLQKTSSSGLCGRNHHAKTVSEWQGDKASKSEGSPLFPRECDQMESIGQNLDINFSDYSVLILHSVMLVVETMFSSEGNSWNIWQPIKLEISCTSWKLCNTILYCTFA